MLQQMTQFWRDENWTLIQGIKVKKPVGEISSEALKEGLLIISAKGNVLRLVPPLVIEKEHVDEMLEILKKVL